MAQIAADRSMLDSVTDRIAGLNKRIGARDRDKLGEYLDAVRDIERRIQRAEEQSDQQLPLVQQPGGIPASFEDHAKLMFDLQVLAFQTDLTRVITFMFGRELSGRTFPELGVVESHHATSHHQNDQVKLLWSLLAELDEPKREVFMMVELDELTVPEAAEILDIPLNTAYSRLRAARQAFEEALARRTARLHGRGAG